MKRLVFLAMCLTCLGFTSFSEANEDKQPCLIYSDGVITQGDCEHIRIKNCNNEMVEAMKAMDKFRPSVDRYGNIVSVDNFERNKSEAILAINKWQKTMQECVQ